MEKEQKDMLDKELRDMYAKLEKARSELIGVQEAKRLLKADMLTAEQASTYAEVLSQNNMLTTLLNDIWEMVPLPDWQNIFYRVGVLVGQIPAETTIEELAERRKKVYIDALLKDASQEERDKFYALFRRDKSS